MIDSPATLLVVAVALFGLDAVSLLEERFGFELPLPDDETGMLSSDLLKWVLAGGIVGYVLLVEGRPLSSIGVEGMAPLSFSAWVVGGTVGTILATAVLYNLYERYDLTVPTEFVGEQATRSPAARLFTAVTAGITETVLYQAYPIERLAPLLGSVVAAGAVSFVVFTAAHYAGDTFSAQETLYIGMPALCVTVLYVLTGNLLVVAAVHSAVNSLSLLSAESDGGPEGNADDAHRSDGAGTVTTE